MNPAKQDFILEKHVFKMMEIETASACEVNCFMEADCVSYNLMENFVRIEWFRSHK